MVSITGNLFASDITLYTKLTKENEKEKRSIGAVLNSRLNKLGYITGISTVSGLVRAALGLIHTIAHLACAIFSKKREDHLQQADIGFKNVVRGLVEATPVIGNISILIVDLYRINKAIKAIKDQNKFSENQTQIIDYRGVVLRITGSEHFEQQSFFVQRNYSGSSTQASSNPPQRPPEEVLTPAQLEERYY